MASIKQKRRDPRSEATQIALIETAEQMFAESGLKAVSTRQIGLAIGSSNNGVVAYHFGSKDGLVDAIYRHRIPVIIARRLELLAEAEAIGKGEDIHELLRALWLPLFEQVNDAGQHSFARFLAATIRNGGRSARKILTSDYPSWLALIDRISERLEIEPGERWELRWRLATSLILESLDHFDIKNLGTSNEARLMFEEVIPMAKAVLTAPSCQIARRDRFDLEECD